MNPPPAFFALAGKVGSTYSNTCSARAGMFERSGRTFAPAGMIWSVEMLSPRRIKTSPSSVSFGGFATGKGPMFGPRTIGTEPRSFGGHSNPDVSTGYFVGSWKAGNFPRSLGSAIFPSSAVAAAVSGLHRYTRSSAVPLRPSKLRLNVRTEAPWVGGENPMPIHGPQATSSSRTPALMSFVMSPLVSMRSSVWREPGETATEIPGAMRLWSSACATMLRSRNDEFTLLPTATCATSVPATSRTDFTLSGLEGHAMRGSNSPRFTSTVSSYSADASGDSRVKSLARPWAVRNAFVRGSDGNTEAVAPSSVPIFAIVPRDGTVSSFRAGPVYSRTLFRPHFTLNRWSSSRITSFALTQGLNCPVKSTFTTTVIVIWYG